MSKPAKTEVIGIVRNVLYECEACHHEELIDIVWVRTLKRGKENIVIRLVTCSKCKKATRPRRKSLLPGKEITSWSVKSDYANIEPIKCDRCNALTTTFSHVMYPRKDKEGVKYMICTNLRYFCHNCSDDILVPSKCIVPKPKTKFINVFSDTHSEVLESTCPFCESINHKVNVSTYIGRKNTETGKIRKTKKSNPCKRMIAYCHHCHKSYALLTK